MTREEMVNALVDMFKESDQDSIMISVTPKDNDDGTCSAKVIQDSKTELFTINGQIGQTSEHLRFYFEDVLEEAIDIVMNENKFFKKVSPAEL